MIIRDELNKDGIELKLSAPFTIDVDCCKPFEVLMSEAGLYYEVSPYIRKHPREVIDSLSKIEEDERVQGEYYVAELISDTSHNVFLDILWKNLFQYTNLVELVAFAIESNYNYEFGVIAGDHSGTVDGFRIDHSWYNAENDIALMYESDRFEGAYPDKVLSPIKIRNNYGIEKYLVKKMEMADFVGEGE